MLTASRGFVAKQPCRFARAGRRRTHTHTHTPHILRAGPQLHGPHTKLASPVGVVMPEKSSPRKRLAGRSVTPLTVDGLRVIPVMRWARLQPAPSTTGSPRILKSTSCFSTWIAGTPRRCGGPFASPVAAIAFVIASSLHRHVCLHLPTIDQLHSGHVSLCELLNSPARVFP